MKQQQKKRFSQVKWQFWLVALGVIIIAGVALADNRWVKRNYIRLSVEHTIHSELTALKPSLDALGFTDLSNLNTQCSDTPAQTRETESGTAVGSYADCDSRVNRYIKVPADTVAFNRHAEELSKALQAHGWTSREDYPTIPWFQKISQGVDYQPDQLNTKTIGDTKCMIDFFTAYSKPQQPAISLLASCSRQGKP